jgi:N-acetylglucosamine-6-sulfatase
MKPSNLRAKLIALITIGILVVIPLAAPQQPLAQARKPNIVFVLVDDMDAATIDRAPEKYAPKIKSLLIDKGVTFPNFFVDVSLCCPSRTSILCGQYAHNTGVLNNVPPTGGFQKTYRQGLEKKTIATSLKANGYRTALIGKYLNGYPNTAPDDTYIPPGWTEWYSPMEKGKKKNNQQNYGNPYTQYNYTLNQNGKLVKYGDKPEDYGTDVYTDFATDFIKRSARDGKPFFLYLAPLNIHSPYRPASRHEHLFQDPNIKAPTPPNFNEAEADFSTKPQFMQKQLQRRLDDEQIQYVDKSYRKRLRSLQSVDEAVGKLVDTLKASGQLDNTYIIFTSDNGYKQGIHRVSLGKESAYEEDIRLNLVVRGPGIPASKKLPQLVGNIDFFPTFTDMAGVRPPAFVDGRSFLTLLKSKTTEPPKWRSAFLVEHTQTQNLLENEENLDNDLLQLADEEQSQLQSRRKKKQELKLPTYQAIRTRNYTYVEYEKNGEKELYDIKRDPYQLHNLASTSDPALLQRLANRLNKLRTCEADSCRAIEEESFRG